MESLKFIHLLLSTVSPTRLFLKREEFYLYVERERLLTSLELLKGSSWLQFSSLLDLYCVDFPEREQRFELTYLLHSYRYNRRVYLRTTLSPSDSVESATALFRSAGWLEREVWDLFGVYFSNHPDLRRLLTDYGFEGFPLRKDFPLVGFVEVRYDDRLKKVVLEPVELTQDYRYFDFLSPWEPPTRPL